MSLVVARLRQNERAFESDSLLKLNLFLHEGLVKVGGRLGNSLLPFENKHLLLLYPDDKVAKWLIKEVHLNTMHGGPQVTLAIFRMQYWIIKGHYAVKNVIRKYRIMSLVKKGLCSVWAICLRHAHPHQNLLKSQASTTLDLSRSAWQSAEAMLRLKVI